jgi:hypothetical protein
MGLISTWIGDVLGISSDERILFCFQFTFTSGTSFIAERHFLFEDTAGDRRERREAAPVTARMDGHHFLFQV